MGLSKSATLKKNVKNIKSVLNVTEVRDSDFKNAFPGIFNYTVGILSGIVLVLRGSAMVSGPDFGHLVTVEIPGTDLTPHVYPCQCSVVFWSN